MHRVVVDDLSLQPFGEPIQVAHELELASTCMASKLTQAGCEIATKKSKVLSNSVSVRANLQLRLASLGVQATWADRNLGIGFTSGKRESTAVRRARLEKSKGACEADQENPWKIVGSAGRRVRRMRTRLCQRQTTMALQSLVSMRRSCDSHGPRRHLALRSGDMEEVSNDGAHDGRK